MKILAHGGRCRLLPGRRGFTLVELNVAMITSAVVMVGLGGIFVSIHRTTERVTYQGTAQMAQSEAIRRITGSIGNAARVTISTRFTTNDTIVVLYPRLKTTEGAYSPELVGSTLKYVAGNDRTTFYLADSTGNPANRGDILWTSYQNGNEGSVIPLASASLHPGTTRGQVQPIHSIRIDAPGNGDPAWLYSVTVTVRDHRNRGYGTRSITSRVYMQNHE